MDETQVETIKCLSLEWALRKYDCFSWPPRIWWNRGLELGPKKFYELLDESIKARNEFAEAAASRS